MMTLPFWLNVLLLLNSCELHCFIVSVCCSALRELHRLEPNEAFWYNLQGKVLSLLKRFDEANTNFRECIRRNPQILEAHHLLAQNLARQSGAASKQEAVKVLQRALEAPNGSGASYGALADMYVLLADTQHSLGLYRAALSTLDAAARDVRIKTRGPGQLQGRLNLMRGRAHFRLNEFAAAESALRKAVAMVCHRQKMAMLARIHSPLTCHVALYRCVLLAAGC